MAGIRRNSRRALLGADPQPEGLRGGAAPASPTRSSCSARPPRRSASETSTARSPRASSASRPLWPPRAKPASRCAARCRARSVAPTRARCRADEVEHVVRLLEGHRRARTSASPTPSAWARRARCRRRWSARSEHYAIARRQRPFPRHLRPGAVEHLRLPGDRRAHLRRQRRRPRRLPVRQGRHRQRGHRRRGVHARRPGHRAPASTSTHWSTPAPSSPSGSAVRRCRASARAAGKARQGVRCDPPRSGLAATSPQGRRQRTGKAGSAASAWARTFVVSRCSGSFA